MRREAYTVPKVSVGTSRAILDVRSARNMGDDCDRLTWEKFANWLNEN